MDYPEDVNQHEDFVIFERKYNAKEVPGNARKPPPSAPIPKASAKSDNPWGDLKLSDKSKDLVGKYKIVRGHPYSIAIELKLNKPLVMEKLINDESQADMAQESSKLKGKK